MEMMLFALNSEQKNINTPYLDAHLSQVISLLQFKHCYCTSRFPNIMQPKLHIVL